MRLVEGKRQFALVRWGLLPSWVKDPKTFSLLINARGESAADKPAFRNAMKRRRCLIPADGFYEWQAAGERKRPFYVRAKSGEPLAFAGLWETWTGPNGEELETAAIVTTHANRTLAAIHERMPVIVPEEAFDLWLDCAEVDAKTAAALIAPAPDDSAWRPTRFRPRSIARPMTIRSCSSRSCAGELQAAPLKPVAKRAPAKRPKKDGGQGALF